MKRLIQFFLFTLIFQACSSEGNHSETLSWDKLLGKNNFETVFNGVATPFGEVRLTIEEDDDSLWRGNFHHSPNAVVTVFPVLTQGEATDITKYRLEAKTIEPAYSKIQLKNFPMQIESTSSLTESVQRFSLDFDSLATFRFEVIETTTPSAYCTLQRLNLHQCQLTVYPTDSLLQPHHYLLSISVPFAENYSLQSEPPMSFSLELLTKAEKLVTLKMESVQNSLQDNAKIGQTSTSNNQFESKLAENREAWGASFSQLQVKGGDPRMRKFLYQLYYMALSQPENDMYSLRLRELFQGQNLVGGEGKQKQEVLNLSEFQTRKLLRDVLDKSDERGFLDETNYSPAQLFWAALGIIPQDGEAHFKFGSPQFEEVKFFLPNGKVFTMEGKNYPAKNMEIERVTQKGKKWDKKYIELEEVLEGGKIVFHMKR